MSNEERILREYLSLGNDKYPEDPRWEKLMLSLVRSCLKDEPRISCGAHLFDYLGICDEDDDMDSFYGPDYFSK